MTVVQVLVLVLLLNNSVTRKVFLFFQDWQHIQLIHVFQEQLICGSRLQTSSEDKEQMADIQNSKIFEECFFLVVLERLLGGSSILHMWKLVISSNGKLKICYDDDDDDDEIVILVVVVIVETKYII